jgi:outer membrane receptor protein involved in Fe transport
LVQDEQEATVSEEVIVTATKREQSIYDVPIAISTFSAATIEKAGITDLTDIGKFVPNLVITGFSGGQTSSVNPVQPSAPVDGSMAICITTCRWATLLRCHSQAPI